SKSECEDDRQRRGDEKRRTREPVRHRQQPVNGDPDAAAEERGGGGALERAEIVRIVRPPRKLRAEIKKRCHDQNDQVPRILGYDEPPMPTLAEWRTILVKRFFPLFLLDAISSLKWRIYPFLVRLAPRLAILLHEPESTGAFWNAIAPGMLVVDGGAN